MAYVATQKKIIANVYPFSDPIYCVFTFAEYLHIRILHCVVGSQMGKELSVSVNKYLWYSAHGKC